MVARKTQGQAATEMLATYGWAFMITAGVIAIAYLFLSASPRSASSCTISGGFSCDSFVIDDYGNLHLELGQGTGREVIVTGIGCGTNPAVQSIEPVIIPSGERRTITPDDGFNCSITSSGAFRGDILVAYRYSDSGFNNTAAGDISFDVVLVQHVTPTPAAKVPCATCQSCAAGHGTCASCDNNSCVQTACGNTSACGGGCSDPNVCAAGACMAKAGNGAACACDGQCASGICKNNGCARCNSDNQCDDANACTADSCSNGACVYQNLACGTACGTKVCNGAGLCLDKQPENGACTCNATCLSGKCLNRVCVGCTTDAHCNDNNACTTDKCTSNHCGYTNLACGAYCASGKVCNGTTSCIAPVGLGKACACNASCASRWCANGLCKDSDLGGFYGYIYSIYGIELDAITVNVTAGTTLNCTNVTNSLGYYQCSRLRPGTYNVSAGRWDWVVNSTVATLALSQQQRVDLILQPNPGFVDGFVLNASGAVLADPTVVVASTGVACRTTGWTQTGYYKCSNLIPGKYNVTGSKAGYLPKNVSVTIAQGGGVRANITLQKIVP